jgi:hypothetical protein
VDNTFYRLAEVALAGVDPFATGSALGGCYAPSEELLKQLYNKSNRGRKAIEAAAAQVGKPGMRIIYA